MPHHRLPTNGNAKARMPPPPPPGPSLGPSLVPVAKMPDRLQHLTGALEVRFKTGAFATWSDMFLRLEGRWLTIYRRERDVMRQAAIELGPGVRVTDLGAHEAATKFPRRFDVFCKGGLLPATEVSFRTKSRKDRDLWVLAIGANIQLLTTLGADPAYAVQDLDPTIDRMKDGLKLHPIRIRSDLVVRCATGEAIVEFLVNEQLARDKHHAILVGRRLLAMNLIHHVVWEQDFTDSHEPFVIAALEDESESYEADHFQKYLDSRKFWKFLDSDGSSSGSRSNRTALRSTGSGGGSVSRNITSSYSSVAAPTPDSVARAPSSFVDNGREDANATAKKAKKCSICTKSFNPLRRRHVCRSCGSPVCGNCSVARRSTEEGSSSSRMCISCKLSATNSSQDDFYDRIFAGPPSNSVSTGNGSTSDMTDPHRTSRASHASSSSSSDLHSASSAAGRGALSGSASNAESTSDCMQCGDSACAPLRDAVDVPYPSVMAPSGGFVSALPFNDEASRLETVSAIRETIAATPNALRVMSQFAQMAAIAAGCPLGAVGLLADGAYHIYALYGVKEDIKSVARSQAFAAHACRNLGPIVVSDVRADVRFAGNPWRREVLQRAAFYAGMPLTLSNGHTVGAVEVFDLEPRYACMDTVAQLQTVVRAVVKLLEDIFAAGSQAKAEAEAEAKAAAAAPAAAPTEQVAEKEPPANEMEAKLLQLLSQTTSTQEQLRTQQTTMVHAISSHSKQISELAKQLERMEATLASKLDGQ